MANTLKLGAGKWATGKDTVLSFNDENGNFKPLPFDFSRASSATVVNQSGLIETVGSGEPRIDFLGNTKGALKLEPQRTNLFTYSENFSQWFQERVTNTDNETTSPDGSLNASLITEDATLNSKYTYLSPTVTTNEHSLSFFAKYKGRYLQVLFGTSDVSGNPYINFDLQNGTFDNNGVSNPSIEDFGNGWYKCSLTVTSAVTSGFGVLFSTIPSFTSSRLTSYQGDGTSGVYIWGAQLEQGSYATSYIKSNSGSATTRVADACSQTPPSGVIGQTEGTMYVEIREKTTPSIDLFECGQGSSQHRFLVYTDASSKLKVLVVNNYSVQVNYTSTVNVDSNAKIAIGYANNNYAIYLNGSLLVTDTIATVPPMNQIAIGSDRGAIVSKSNQIKEFKLYNTRLSNSELAALTQ